MSQAIGHHDYETRESLYGYYDQPKGIIEGLKIEWTSEIASVDGAIYHCWIPRGTTDEDRKKIFELFKKASRKKGDPVGFSWDWTPTYKVITNMQKFVVEHRDTKEAMSQAYEDHYSAWAYMQQLEREIE